MDLKNIQTHHMGKAISMRNKVSRRLELKQSTEQLQNELDRFVANSTAKTLEIQASVGEVKLASDLPIASKAADIIRHLEQNQVIIVAGETGCGKTTQLPKICLQAGLGRRGLIGHTQPRRVAATSVARRIAEELGTDLGDKVGYSIRFQNKVSPNTRVKLMTDGVLLAELEVDPMLSKYEVLIIDEAHERSLNIDFLLGFIKKLLNRRKDLKVIITSATIDPDKFSQNFGRAPIVLVEGRSYPVEVRYRPIEADEQNADTLMNAIVNAVDECCAEASGDILIFADGEGQIKSITKTLSRITHGELLILPLYARLGVNEQQKIFAKSGKRKIIVSTNVAETSLTVPGILFVIDIGMARISRFSQRNKIQQLPVEKISRASADQRKGRCGRIAPGICIRLYSEEDYEQREAFTLPEIKRTNLTSVVLRLKAMNVHEVERFPFMQPPDERAWKIAFNSLFELGALDKQQTITKIGRSMASLPVDPQLSRILVDDQLTAVDEMLVFCALMSVREVRERPHDKQQKADQLHQKYIQKDSDILTAIFLWRQMEAKKQELSSNAFKKWCRDNLINFLGLLEWRRVYFQLKEAVQALGKTVNQSPVSTDEVHQALIPGFVTHIFCKTQERFYQGVRGLKIWLHPSSLSFKKSMPWLLSAEMMETEKLYARMNAPIKPEWIEKVAPHLLKNHYQDIHWRKNRGHVVALLNQSLLGLPVVNQRLVNYSAIDSEQARKIFLEQGLAAEQLSESFPFLLANQKKLRKLEEQEQKQRLNNIRINQLVLAELYAQKLPSHIVSQISLKRWLKKDFKKRNQQLSFSIEELTDNQPISEEAYPSEIEVNGFRLSLSYSFAPGTNKDGVSVEIPENMLTQFSDRDFDWLVPGYLEQKVLATLKVLPKATRRALIPLNETAAHCTRELLETDQKGKRFIDELARMLQRLTAIQIRPADFDMDALEPFLNMKYKVIGKKGTQTIRSLSQTVKPEFVERNNQSQVKQEGFRTWPDENFVVEKQVNLGNLSSRVFQAFVDVGNKVVIENFPTEAIALEQHLLGTARLLLLQNQSIVRKFANTWPDKNLLERLNLRNGGFSAIFDVQALVVASRCIYEVHPVCAKRTFEEISQIFAQNFRKDLSQKLNQIVGLLKQREKRYLEIGSLNPNAYQESLTDIRRQLKELWQPQTLLMVGDELAEKYQRYHEALTARIKRIKANYPKEEQAMETWCDWLEWWDEIMQSKPPQQVSRLTDTLFWMLQEFRISLFSPGVKVLGGVSSKKLQRKFEELEEAIERFR